MIEKLGYYYKANGEAGMRIFSAELTSDKKGLVLTESCDEYFSATLTKKEVIELSNDFMKIAEGMIDV